MPLRHEDFFAGILDSTNLVIYLKDIGGQYLYVNRRYELVSTVAREHIVGKHDEDLFAPDVASLFRAQDAQVIERRGPIEYEETIQLPGGMRSFITEKFPLIDPSGQVYAVGGFCTEITSQNNRAHETQAAERERLAVTLSCIGEGIISTDMNGCVLLMNPTAEAMTGMRQTDAAGRAVDEILRLADAGPNEGPGRLVNRVISSDQDAITTPDWDVLGADGAKRRVVPNAALVRDRTGRRIGAVLSLRDVTEQRKLQAQLQQAQKLEAVGLLAGGLAHDFNNVLTTIVGYNYFLLEGLEPGSPLRSLSLEIRKAADLAASLTRHVLAVTRKQVVQLRVMEPNSVVLEMAKMFRRLLGANIKLDLNARASLWPVKMDCGQLEQILMNLVINARDAMPHGGRLSIATRNHAIREGGEAGLELPAGQYVCLEVRDTGLGMDESVQARIFEPFFTTKEIGRGTGLGLSTIKSIVRDYHGGIAVESAPGKGSVFRVYLPRAEGGAESILPGEVRKSGGEGNETILVVEDNATLCSLIKKILREKGYRVFSAATGKEAQLLCGRIKEHLDLLLCDLILPDCHGTDVAKGLCAAQPGIKVTYMSGYPGGVLGSDSRIDGAVLIEKPFSPETLLRTLRQSLDSHQTQTDA